MIEIKELSKYFAESGVLSLDNITLTVPDNSIVGLIGINGAGKSTLLRIAAGIYKQDSGTVAIDGKRVYENNQVKSQIAYISDDQYYQPGMTMKKMAMIHSSLREGFSIKKFYELAERYGLDVNRRLSGFSKGMRRQSDIVIALSYGAKYLLCDETFDGLDPVMRQAVKAIFVREMEERGLTPVIASHNLRELEDICEYVGLLHKGGILFEKDLDEMKLNLHKVQCVVKNEEMLRRIREGLDVATFDNRGSLYTLTVRGGRTQVESFMDEVSPVFYELLPLSLEEIFISETEVKGYDVKALIL